MRSDEKRWSQFAAAALTASNPAIQYTAVGDPSALVRFAAKAADEMLAEWKRRWFRKVEPTPVPSAGSPR